MVVSGLAVAAERPMRVPFAHIQATIRCDRSRDGLCGSRIAQPRAMNDIGWQAGTRGCRRRRRRQANNVTARRSSAAFGQAYRCADKLHYVKSS